MGIVVNNVWYSLKDVRCVDATNKAFYFDPNIRTEICYGDIRIYYKDQTFESIQISSSEQLTEKDFDEKVNTIFNKIVEILEKNA